MDTVHHRPINADSKNASLECVCGWASSENHKSLEDAWDEYDEHTME